MIASWMINKAKDEGEKHIFSEAVAQFPDLYRSSDNANIAKASRLWKDRHRYLPDTAGHVQQTLRGTHSAITRRVLGIRARVDLKARKVRGRKRATWVDALHRDWMEEFRPFAETV